MRAMQSKHVVSILLPCCGSKEGWKVIDDHHLEKEFPFRNFKEALDFTNRVGAIAEQEGHHPDILLRWGRAKLTVRTHSINGLSENDFILAAKADGAVEQSKTMKA